ncbi:hypothetical protein [Pandoraea eparura]|uniref:hypothetical protein n=1 Tax=Pandoraea eparura TaxID=2508291 RepID=UPI001581C5CB|nr:hypothetical protein [Pandoraea eparura]
MISNIMKLSNEVIASKDVVNMAMTSGGKRACVVHCNVRRYARYIPNTPVEWPGSSFFVSRSLRQCV